MLGYGRERDTGGSFWTGFVIGALAGVGLSLLACADKRHALGGKIRVLRAKACCCGEEEGVEPNGASQPVEEKHCAHGFPNTEEG